MNTFIRLSDGREMTEQDIDPLCIKPSQNFNPDPSLYVKVLPSVKPQPSAAYKQVVRNGAVQDTDGNWVEDYAEIDMFADTTGEDGVTTTKAEHEAAYQAELDAELARDVRMRRNSELAESDWVILRAVEQNAQASQVWLDYRQALRDITSHADFPYVSPKYWPTKPE